MDQLVNTTVLVSTVVDLALVYFLFRVHRREWLGGPGPLLIHPKGQTGRGGGAEQSPEG
jgi:hypothetical protein